MAYQFNIPTTFNVIAYTIYMYDYALTFTSEVDLFWSRPRRTWAFALFVANRYVALLGRVPAFVGNFLPDSGGPQSPVFTFHLTDEVIMAVLQLIGGVVMLMHVYAFYDGNRWVVGVLHTAAEAHAVGTVDTASFLVPVHVPDDGRSGVPPVDIAGAVRSLFPFWCPSLAPTVYVHAYRPPRAPRYAAAWAGQVVFDALVFGLTLWRLLLRGGPTGERTFVDMLIRDGTLYFAFRDDRDERRKHNYLSGSVPVFQVHPVQSDEHVGVLFFRASSVCAADVWAVSQGVYSAHLEADAEPPGPDQYSG
ncbi:hypothetical protein ID866_7277, partial [Astraeus odoratus]